MMAKDFPGVPVFYLPVQVLSLLGGNSVPYTVAPYKAPLDSERETGLCGIDGTLNLAYPKQAER